MLALLEKSQVHQIVLAGKLEGVFWIVAAWTDVFRRVGTSRLPSGYKVLEAVVKLFGSRGFMVSPDRYAPRCRWLREC